MEKRRWIVSGAIACVVVLVMPVFGVMTVKASPDEWTKNATFIKIAYRWDLILYNWEWSLKPFFGGTLCYEVWEYDDYNYAVWPGDGVIRLAACDPSGLDNLGRSARVTYGPFVGGYPSLLPPPLNVTSVYSLKLKGVVRNYGSINPLITRWTGIKFDAWFRDPLNNDRRMVIQMYFHGTGLQGVWGNEMFRPIGDDIDDYIIKLQAFPEYCNFTGDKPESEFWFIGSYFYTATEFTIDLGGIWQRGKDHFGRSYADQLYAVALDVESGSVGPEDSIPRPFAFAEVNEIRVTYLTAPVGGIQIPVNKFELLAPYIVGSVVLVASVVSVALFKRRKKEG